MAQFRPSGGDLSRLRRLNCLTTLIALRDRPNLTLTELAQHTGLARASVEEVVRDLDALGWVAAVPPVPGVMGRPARRYRYRAEAGHVLGIDIGANSVRAAAADLAGAVRGLAHRAVTPQTPTDGRLAAMDAAIAECLTMAGLSPDRIWATAAGSTGLISPDHQILLAASIPGWAGTPVAGHLAGYLPGPVQVRNDSQLAALAEYRRGAAVGVHDMVFLLAGRRTGAASVIDGRMHRGYGGVAGEITLLPGVNMMAATTALGRCPVVPAGTPDQDAAAQVFKAARAGDRTALAAVRDYVRELARCAAAMVLTLDPQVVVLGGGFSRSADMILDPLGEELDQLCPRMPELRPSVLGEESVALGGICLALEQVDRIFFTPEGCGPLAPAELPAR